MATAGTVLFQRGKTGTDSDTDLWDDTALIKAYDHAVNKVKAQMKKQSGNEASDSGQNTQKATNKKKNSKRKKKRKQRQKKVWKVGDTCRAVFSEDGLLYEAEIVSLDTDTGSCVVQYVGYGNEEEQALDDIQPASRRTTRQDSAVTGSDVEGTSVADSMDWTRAQPGSIGSKASYTRPHSQMPQYPWAWHHNYPPHPMPPPNYPYMPSMPPHSNTPFRMPNNIPFMPPPPPILDEDVEDSNNEALCSMLMSWYMSGYHTGYYQGLKQGQQNNQGGVSPRPDTFR